MPCHKDVELAIDSGIQQTPSDRDRRIYFQMSFRAQSVAVLLGSDFGWREKTEGHSQGT